MSVRGLFRTKSVSFLGVLALAAFFAAVLLASPATAQDDSAPQEKDKEEEVDQETYTERIRVTSRKREEDLQDVPFSVAAPTEETLRKRGAQNMEGVAANVAGFNVQNLGPGQSQVAMRGISAGQIVRDQPGVKEQVGVYLDESVISLSLFTPDIDLFDVSRVEVLRGPQGTLFGSGSLSGTVRYITNPPKYSVEETFGEFTMGNIDGGDFGGSVKVATNVPFGPRSALRITAYSESFAGYMDAVQPDLSIMEDVNSGDRTGARAAFRFQPTDTVTVTPRVIYQSVEMDGWNRIDDYNILANPFTTTRPAVTLGERQLFTQLEEAFTDDFLLADLSIRYGRGGFEFVSITSYTDRDILVVRDATALTASITGGTQGLPENIYTIDGPLDDDTTAKVLTQEFRVSGETERLNWVAGAFYSTIERDYGQSLIVFGYEDASGIATQGLRAAKDELFYSDLDYEFDQVAAFGEVNIQVSDTVDLTAGARYYDFEEDRTQIFDGIFGNDDNGTLLVQTSGSTSADGLVPRLIGSFQLRDNWNLNAQVSKGFRLGGINDPLNVPLCTPEDLVTFGGRDTWEDEEVWNYEVGSKSTIMGGRGSFNIAAFHMDITDLQATVTAGSCSSRLIFNVPDSRSTGLEFELTAQPNQSFDFAISASFTDSELQSTVTSTDMMGNVSVVSGIQDGNRLPTVPELQVAAAATYQWLLQNNWLVYLTGTYQHVGERFTQIGDQAVGFGTVDLLAFSPNDIGGPLTQTTFSFNPELPAYDIANLRLGFKSKNWDTSFFVNNLTDERALLALDQERGTLARVGYLTNQPRMFGITTRTQF